MSQRQNPTTVENGIATLGDKKKCYRLSKCHLYEKGFFSVC